MKAFKETTRTYYKYQYNTWTQPVATANTTAIEGGNMVITASAISDTNYAYYGFNNNLSNSWGAKDMPSWWQIQFPYKIKITGLTFYNKVSSGSALTKNAQFFTSSDRSNSIGNAFVGSSTSAGATVISGIPSDGIITDTIYLYVTSCYQSDNHHGMSNLQITATKQTIVEGTSSDYDFYVDVDTYKVVNDNGTYKAIKYY